MDKFRFFVKSVDLHSFLTQLSLQNPWQRDAPLLLILALFVRISGIARRITLQKQHLRYALISVNFSRQGRGV